MGHRVLRLGILLGTICLGIIGPSDTHASSISPARLKGDPTVPWQISADTVSYDAETTTYHARGNVIIEKQDTRLSADRVAFNQGTMTASASGHVVMTAGQDIITGDQVQLDMRRETGEIHKGGLFLSENHFTIRGDRIEKTGKQSYSAQHASITSCDGEDPDWIITARTIEVTIEGYGTATHAVFRAAEIPLLYTPYLLFPAKSKRQTGASGPHARIFESSRRDLGSTLFLGHQRSLGRHPYHLFHEPARRQNRPGISLCAFRGFFRHHHGRRVEGSESR